MYVCTVLYNVLHWIEVLVIDALIVVTVNVTVCVCVCVCECDCQCEIIGEFNNDSV